MQTVCQMLCGDWYDCVKVEPDTREGLGKKESRREEVKTLG